MSARIRICANGTPRYADGKVQRVSDPCNRPALAGHIHCEPCRRDAGGYPARSARPVRP